MSYANGGDTAKLVKNLFVPTLRDCLHDRVATSRKDCVFLDAHDASNGGALESRICGPLQSAKVLLAFIDKRYWTRSWCQREWTTFLERERRVGRRRVEDNSPALIYPIWAIAPFDLPPEADGTLIRRSVHSFRKLAPDRPRRPPAEFRRVVDEIAGELSHWLEQAPPFDSTWPVTARDSDVPGPRPGAVP